VKSPTVVVQRVRQSEALLSTDLDILFHVASGVFLLSVGLSMEAETKLWYAVTVPK